MTTKSQVVQLMDLTSLNDDDSEISIAALCEQAENALGRVAALCIYSAFVSQVRNALPKEIKVATVVNFPSGNESLERIETEVKNAIKFGADEIDVVIPYHDYIAYGHSDRAKVIVSRCKELMGAKKLKVIIESGALSAEMIRKASNDAIEAGADFIKTSTGKIPQGASLEAAEIMLKAIQASGKTVGFKASGGIRTYAQAKDYIDMTKKICGEDFIHPRTFRFGVSGLLKQLLDGTEVKGNY